MFVDTKTNENKVIKLEGHESTNATLSDDGKNVIAVNQEKDNSFRVRHYDFETGEVVKSLVDKIKPDLVICVDALGSRRLERVNRTIQIGDTGISPGAGVGNPSRLAYSSSYGGCGKARRLQT